MKSLLAAAAIAIFVASAFAWTEELAPAHPVPFTIEAGADVSSRFPGSPRLHSFAWAQWHGKWIFVAGRTAGYHGVGGSEADFSPTTANTRIWVIDPSEGAPAHTYSFPVADLPESLAAVKAQWTSSSLQFFQDHDTNGNDTLYLAGGYGQNESGAWVTHDLLSSVSLPALVQGVTEGRDTFSSTISYVRSPLVQASGGEMLKLDDGFFYLAGGHVFTGSYSDFEGASEKNSATASQTYLGEIRKLRIAHDTGKLTVSLADRYENPEFARRDLNVAFRILQDGHSLGAAIYGGVFTKDQLAFTKPIYWTSTAAPAADDTFEQKMSSYTCAHLLLFDSDSHAMYTTFFGGISGWTWNYAKGLAEPAPHTGTRSDATYFDGLTWIDHITTLAQQNGKTLEITDPVHRLPAYLGTDAAFLPAPGLAKIREDADVYNLAPLRGKRTLAGYIFGGIRAFPKEFPYHDSSRPYRSGAVPTKASDMIVPVYVTVPAN